MSSPTGQSKKTIHQLREERGWTQQEVADRLGLDWSLVAKWETGTYLPLPVTQQRLAVLFGVGVGEIAFGQMEEQP